MEGITVYLYFLWLSAHLSFLLSVSCQSLCLHALPDKSKTPSPLWVCACPFLRVYVSLCAVWWQWVTVSNGPDLEVGMHLLCMCLCVCVGARQIVLCACVCVCVCVPSYYDGDSWEGTGRCSAPFRPDAPVTSWPCSLLSTSLSIQQEDEGGGAGRVKPVTHTQGMAILPWAQTSEQVPWMLGSQDQRNNLE